MRTRTLLLLAVACGVAILAAGVALFVRIGDPDEGIEPSPLGAPVSVGDLTVTVERSTETARLVAVIVELGGVDDDAGTDDFRLVVPGESIAPSAPDGEVEPPACDGTTVESVRCTLLFEIGAVEGSSRVLLYRRGDERVRWELG